MPPAREYNFDGLPGPTHHYGGHSWGNLASTAHRDQPSNPREAALQGLRKMTYLADLGLAQGWLPPQERPDLQVLRRLGFCGSDAAVLEQAARHPRLLEACGSASAMWTANAAIVTPSADSSQGRVQFTPANLVSNFHRSIETAATARVLRVVFPDPEHFLHHEPLPAADAFADEGAANHTRFCREYGEPGVHLFVFGRRAFGGGPRPARFAARQTLEACEAIARQHGLPRERAFFVQQDPHAIDAGVFHNDVISVGNRDLFLHHENAFVDTRETVAALGEIVAEACGVRLKVLDIGPQRMRIDEAVRSYFFNSQLVTLPGGRTALIVPSECRAVPRVRELLDELTEGPGSPIDEVHELELRQSMQNGGGPACLRLRVVLNEREAFAVLPGALVTGQTCQMLSDWVIRHYRDELRPEDLGDPELLDEGRRALDELTGLFGLGSLYPFQRET